MSVGAKHVVRGVIVGLHASGDGSLRVKIYTDALGLVSAFAKSAREERSKLRAHLQIGTLGTFSLVKGRDTWHVTGATETKNMHFEASGNAAVQEAAARVVSFVRQFVRGEGSDPYFFETLWHFFNSFPYEDEATLKDAECVAIVRMLASLGYVEEKAAVSPFLASPYGLPLVKDARSVRPVLIQAINEGLSASGLS